MDVGRMIWFCGIALPVAGACNLSIQLFAKANKVYVQPPLPGVLLDLLCFTDSWKATISGKRMDIRMFTASID
eukprot:2892600-Amphidinium_carterae.1